MATVSLVDVNYQSSRNRFEILFPVSFSGLTRSDFIVNGNTNSSVNTEYVSGNTQHMIFGGGVPVGESGYLRFLLPADALTPNLSEDLDWTFYWGTDGVLHDGATDSVRTSRERSTLNNVRWLVNSANAGQTVGIELQFDRQVVNLEADDVILGEDITSLSNFSFFTDRQRYRANVTLPSDLGEGGSFTLQITDRESLYPGLGVSEEWTLLWSDSGRLTATKTADLPVVVTATLSKNYVTSSEQFRFILDYSKDALPPPFDQISLTDGVSISAEYTPHNRRWIYTVTAPSTGKGTGVISIPENVISPGNNAVSVSFIYIDSIEAEISLSAASIENGGTIIAQFDFDYDVPNFRSDFVDVGSAGNNIIGIGTDVLAINGSALGILDSDANVASVGIAQALDDNNRTWIVPVSVPQSGEGELEISLPQDAIGFSHAAVMAPVQFAPQNAPSINLNIKIRDNLTLLPLFGRDFDHAIDISGNGEISVNVQGLLRPFYHHWDSTDGKLHIRGRPEEFYKDLEFTVSATDQNSTTSKNAAITVITKPPRILPPEKLVFAKGLLNSLLIPIENSPLEGSVGGTWIGLDHKVTPDGIIIFGDVPSDREATLGVNRGEFKINASNTGGDAKSEMVQWEIGSPTRPKWRKIQNYKFGRWAVSHSNDNLFENYLLFPINHHIDFNLIPLVDAIPIANITMDEISDNLGTVTVDEMSILTGRRSGNTNVSRSLTASNNVSSQIISTKIIFRSEYVAPEYIGPTTIPDISARVSGTTDSRTIISRAADISNRFSTYFNLNNSWMSFSGFGELVGITNTTLYDPNNISFSSTQRRNNLNLDTPYINISWYTLRLTTKKDPALSLYGVRIPNAEYQEIRGTYPIRLRFTNLLGSAETPEFNLIIP